MKKSFLFISAFFIFQHLVAQNIPHANFTAPWGVQVNTYNGNLYFERTDLLIPNQGLSIDLSFAYNSFRDTLDIGFGKGWTSTYSMRYETINADSILVEMADGRRDLYVNNGTEFLPPPGIFDQWEVNSPGQFQLTTKYGMEYFFDDPGHQRLSRIKDTNGNQLLLEYSPEGELILITDQSNRSVNLAWTDGHLTTITDNNLSATRMVTFTYDDDLLTSVTDPENEQISYTYNGKGTLDHIINERGDEMLIRYNQKEKVAVLVTCIAHITFTYNPDVGKTYVTEKNNSGDRITTYAYDEMGKLIKKTGSCCGYNTQYQYDEDNNVNMVTDANNNQMTASHDALGNILFSSDADGANQAFTFDNTLNRLESLTDKKGNATMFGYDANGNLETVNQPEGVNLGFDHDTQGNIVSLTDGNGNATMLFYNPNNDIIKIEYPIGEENFQYDEVGNLMVSTDANSQAINYGYDALNRITSVADDLENTIFYDYDASSNLTYEKDANEHEKFYTYDAHHRLESVTTPSGTTSYGYDASDNLTSITDAELHTSSFEYDHRDLLISESDPLNNSTIYSYDGNGNILSRTDANGLVTTYSYDNLNRLLSKSYDGNTDNYSYDANGNLLECSNNHISMSFTYDDLNRLTSKTINNWGLTISYEYDMAGNRTKMMEPGGMTTYEYDINNRLIRIVNPANEVTEFAYDTGGRLIRQDFHNGTYAEYEYDLANRLISLIHKSSAGSVMESSVYTYDGNGNRLSMTTLEGEAIYTYDGDNRLTSVDYIDINATDEIYSFDGAGNRTELNGTPYSYDAADRIQSAGSTTYDFDANGNLISKQESGELTRYHYDGENRLVRVELPGGEEVAFRYDPFGNRISQTGQAGTTRYLLDGDNVLQELDASGTTLARYTTGLTLDSWISMERNGQSYFYHTDGLGSVKALTNASENIEAEYRYDAYGNILSTIGNVANPYRYTGREFDTATGLYYYRTRFYDAEVGRFITKDGFPRIQELPQSINRYNYVFQNPIIYNDPNGELIFLAILVPAAKVAITAFLGAAAIGTTTSIIEQIGDLESIEGEIDCGKAIIDGIDKGIKEFWDPGKKIARGQKLIGAAIRVFWKKKNKELAKKLAKKGAKKYLKGSAQGGLYDSIKEKAEENFSFNCNPFSPGNQEETPYGPLPPLPTLPDPGDDDCDVCIPIIRSVDSNEIIAPAGCGVQNWIAQSATLPYTILYENDPDFATAPAQTVVIEHFFDSEVNPFAFRLGDFGFGDYYFEVPNDLSFYNTQIDLSDSLNVLLDVTAGLDIDNNRAFWIFESKDPATGQAANLPADAGYLPVNDSITHAGEGFVNFTIRASNTSLTWDTIHAQADIIFDDNPPILTNLAFNLIDADHPISLIDSVEPMAGNQLKLTWSASDIGSGIDHFLLYVSTNEGPFLPIVDDLTGSEYTFQGEAGNTYEFFTIAVDCAGNIEPLKDTGENGCALSAEATLVQPTGTEANGSISISVFGAAGNLTYDWTPDVSTDSVATNLIAATYAVTVTDELGCSAALEIVLDSIMIAVEEVVEAERDLFIYRLFPIPATSVVNVEFISPSAVVWLEVFSPDGKQVLGKTINATPDRVNQESLEVSNWAAGTYLVRIRTKGKSVSAMFIKQ